MRNKLMLLLYGIVTVIAVYAQDKPKKFNLKNHNTVTSMLGDVKSYGTQSMNASRKWPDSVRRNLDLMYMDVKTASDHVIDKYKRMIQDWKASQNDGVDLTDDLLALETANNKMVTYFKNNFMVHGSGSGLTITAEVIDLIFSTGEKIYKFVKKIKQEEKDKFRGQVEDQRMPDLTTVGSNK